jgi:hypothetical protein
MAEAFPRATLELWRACRDMQAGGKHIFWADEREGGCRGEYRDHSVRLHVLLGLAPNQCSPLDAFREAPPAWMRQPWRQDDYRRAHQLARLLDEAADRAERREARPRAPATPVRARGADE